MGQTTLNKTIEDSRLPSPFAIQRCGHTDT